MRTLLVSLLSISCLHAIDHGPYIQWFQDPCHEAEIRWVDRSGFQAKEGEWSRGRGGFGYGDNDDQTVLNGMQNKYTIVSIRKKITLAAPANADDELIVEALYDDGFVLYIDGKEVLRKNSTSADAELEAPEGHEAKAWEKFSLGKIASSLKTGSIVAMQGVNDKLDSSDFSLDIRLSIKGKTSTDLITRSDSWEYLVNQIPEKDWRTSTSLPDAVPWKADAQYTLGYRPVGNGEMTWTSANSHLFARTESKVFSVSLKGLKADTRYEFSIRNESTKEISGPHLMQTAPETFRPMHFVIGGDMFHTLPLLDAMNIRCGQEAPLFAALIGDHAYTNNGNPDRWYQWIDSWVTHCRAKDGRLIPMVMGIGNHEVAGGGFFPENNTPTPDKADEFYTLFRMSSEGSRVISRYAVDFGNYLSFILLDSGHTEAISRQVPFLAQSSANRKKTPFLFAAYHRPAWGSGCKDDAVDIQQKWCPIFEKNGVDAVFEHDHHTYKRTWPLTAGKRDDANGIPYLGDGAWGVAVRNPSKAELQKRPWIAKQAPINHLIRVTLAKDGFTCDALTADGKTFDSGTYPLRK